MFKIYITEELEKFSNETYLSCNGEGTLSFGKMIRATIVNREDKTKSPMEWLDSADDEEFYGAIQNAIENERDEQ